MKTHRPGNRGRLLILPLLLLVVALVGVACAPASPSATAVPAPSAAPTAPAASVPEPTVASGGEPVAKVDVPVGVDADGNFYRGDPKAAVKLVEYSDFQWPYCARHVTETGPLLDEAYIAKGEVLSVFRHFPLEFHPNAMPAAKASYCAGQQDPKFFWDMHEWLFASQATWSEAADAADQFRKQALAVGADGAKYDTCMSDPATEARIERDIQDGMSAGVQGTPAFFINDWFLSGAYPFAEFQKLIEKAKQGLHPPPTPTPLPQGVDFFEADPNRAGLTYDGSPSLGKTDAGLVLLSFEDYKNPDAAQHATAIEPALKTKYVDTGQMRLVVKPLADTAPRAAVAAVCAARQDKFWEFRTLLYEKQAEWQEGDDAAMSGYAKSLGLDQVAFDACLKDATAQNEVDYATAFGQEIGVPVVPSFLVLKIGASGKAENSKGLPGAQTLEQIEQAIQELQAPPTPTPVAIAPEKLASLQVGVDADGNFYRGDPNAPIKLVDFSDFQWPYCARHSVQTGPLLDEAYAATGRVVNVFRNFPLDFHPNAVPAAKAAYCAGQQDPKLFWDLHDWLFQTQDTWAGAKDAADQFRMQALAIGADGAKYDACLTDANTDAAIQRDLKDGAAQGVRGTPAFFIVKAAAEGQAEDPKFISGALPFDQFAQAIDQALAGQ